MINFLSIYSKKENKDLTANKDQIFEKSKNHLLFKTKQSYFYESPNKTRLSFFFANDDINKHIAFLKNKNELLFFSGCLLKDNDDEFAEDIVSAYKNKQKNNLLEEIGSFCMGKIGSQEDYFYQGVLSQWNVFYGENEDLFVVSDNPYLVSIAINNAIEFNYEAMIQKTFAFCDVGAQTNFKKVLRFPSNAVLFIPSNNVPYFKCVTDKLYKKTFVSDWLENFDKAYNALLKTTKAIANASRRGATTKAQLTGGFDSRLILSFTLATNTQDNFEFESWGTNSLDDNDIADIRTVRLIEKEFPNLNISYKNICDVLDINETNFQTDINNLIKLTAGTTYGPNLAFRSTNNLINETVKYEINGRFGEVSRGYLSLKNNSLVGINSPFNISTEVKDNDNLKWLNKSYQKQYLVSLKNTLKTLPSVYDLDLTWGLCWMAQNHAGLLYRNSMSPLCNPLLHHCAFTTFTDYRLSNSMVFNMMYRSSPKLTKIPFAGTRWNPIVYLNREDAPAYAKIPRVASNVKNVDVISDKITQLRLNAIYNQLFDIKKEFFDYLNENEYKKLLSQKDTFLGNNADTLKAYHVFTLGSQLIIPNTCSEITFKENLNLKCNNIISENLPFLETNPYENCDFGTTKFSITEMKENNYYVVTEKNNHYMKENALYNNKYRYNNIYFKRDLSLDVSINI